MITDVFVKELMSKNLKTLHPKDKLKAAKALFNEYNIHHIPVEVMGELKGIISLGDLLFLENIVTNSFDQFLQKQKLETAHVDEIMTAKPYYVESEARMSQALDIMTNNRVNALPVVEKGKLVGLITSYDLLQYLRKKIG